MQSLVPLIDEFPTARTSRFDVALFYTGGKASTFLLYHLVKQQNLRVLALTWEIPFLSDSAKASMENAKVHFSNVEFLQGTVSRENLKKIYSKLYKWSGSGYHSRQLYSLSALRLSLLQIRSPLCAPPHVEALFAANAEGKYQDLFVRSDFPPLSASPGENPAERATKCAFCRILNVPSFLAAHCETLRLS